MKREFFLGAIILLALNFTLFSQVIISDDGPGTPDSAAVLKLESTTKGFQLPVLTTDQMNAIENPSTGLMVFNSDDNSLYYYVGVQGSWAKVGLSDQGVLVDSRDGQTYATVKIGRTWIMAQNLNYGSLINLTTQPSDNDGTIEKYCYNDDGNQTECNEWGAYYRFSEIDDEPEGLCPAGWVLPQQSSFASLIGYFGGQSSAGNSLKEYGVTHWNNNDNSTNSSGYSARGSGKATQNGVENLKGNSWHLSSDNQTLQLQSGDGNANIQGAQSDQAYNVRCIKLPQ